jgi:hypothetical protein
VPRPSSPRPTGRYDEMQRWGNYSPRKTLTDREGRSWGGTPEADPWADRRLSELETLWRNVLDAHRQASQRRHLPEAKRTRLRDWLRALMRRLWALVHKAKAPPAAKPVNPADEEPAETWATHTLGALAHAWKWGPGARAVMYAMWRDDGGDWEPQRFTVTNRDGRVFVHSTVTGEFEARPGNTAFDRLWPRVFGEVVMGLVNADGPAWKAMLNSRFLRPEALNWTLPRELSESATGPGLAAEQDLKMRGHGAAAVVRYRPVDLEATYGERFTPTNVWQLTDQLAATPDGPKGIVRVASGHPAGYREQAITDGSNMDFQYLNVF